SASVEPHRNGDPRPSNCLFEERCRCEDERKGVRMRFEGGVAVITGAGSGIGREIGRRFATEGAVVVIDDVNDDRGEATVRTITEAGGQAIYIRADVSREEDVAS